MVAQAGTSYEESWWQRHWLVLDAEEKWECGEVCPQRWGMRFAGVFQIAVVQQVACGAGQELSDMVQKMLVRPGDLVFHDWRRDAC